jgi:phosphoribosyl 1,2-cyclic phosphodiesterase
VPSPGPTTVVCGGNTSCVELSLDDGTVLVLDAGTGIRDLGDDLVERGVRRIHLLLTHLHLDHVEGLRFFAPLFDPNVTLDVWGPPSTMGSLEDSIARTFSPPLFPIDLGVVPAQVAFHDAPRQPWKLESALLTAALVVHPGPTLGYRIEADGSSVAYVPDHEPALTGIEERPSDWISGAAIAEGVDVLLHDAQYFEDEYEQRIGWGHSSVSDTIAYAKALRVKRLVLFHHEPHHSDDVLSGLEERAQDLIRQDGGRSTLAREGMVVELS